MFRLRLVVVVLSLSAGLVCAFADPAVPASSKSDAASSAKAARNEPAQKMERFVVDSESTMSFGIGLKIQKYTLTNKVLAMYVDAVEEGSDAEAKGIRAGMRIVAIDGRPVTEFEATFKPGSDLRRLFIGRNSGDKVVLDFDALGTPKPKRVTIVQRTVSFRVKMRPLSEGKANPFGMDVDPIFNRPMSTDRTAPVGEPPAGKDDTNTDPQKSK